MRTETEIESPQLKDDDASPGRTTIAGVHELLLQASVLENFLTSFAIFNGLEFCINRTPPVLFPLVLSDFPSVRY